MNYLVQKLHVQLDDLLIVVRAVFLQHLQPLQCSRDQTRFDDSFQEGKYGVVLVLGHIIFDLLDHLAELSNMPV